MSPTKKTTSTAPTIGADQIALLERLCNAISVSGNESEVRTIVLEQLKPLTEDVRVDALGNVLAIKHAKGTPSLKVMLAAHMDEVGFMLVNEDGDGLFEFRTVGGIDPRQLPGKQVLVGKDHLPGVIGARPIHLIEHDEMEVTMPVKSLRIDIGPGGKGKANPGDWAGFATQFMQVGPSLRAKALDNRLGVCTVLEMLKTAPEQLELMVAFTVQEEIGLRGARVAGYTLNPDLAIAVDSTPALDLPMWDNTENDRYNTKLGQGPAIYISDAGTISDPRLVRFLAATGEKYGIPFQFRQPGGGGTDAGSIHKQREGIPSVSLSVPGRHAHTAITIARLSDWQNTLNLLHAALTDITPSVLSQR
jgi:endoglucanase